VYKENLDVSSGTDKKDINIVWENCC